MNTATLHVGTQQTDTTQDLDGGQTAEEDFADLMADMEALDDADGFLEAVEGNEELAKTTDAAVAELEELLRPTTAHKVAGEFSLDDLLTESLDAINESAAVKAGRKKLRDTRTTSKERAEIEARIKEWELAREWKPAATVAMFHQQLCVHCFSNNRTFDGLFQRQVHRHSKINRWVRQAEVFDSGLDKEHKLHTSSVEVCEGCLEEQGFAAVHKS
jgi:hypothetical protein